MQPVLKGLIISAVAIFLLANAGMSVSYDVEAKKKISYPKYSVQVNFINACSCTYPVTVKFIDYEGKVFEKFSVKIGKLADQQDDSEIHGPKVTVTQKPDRHPNELRVCFENKNADCNQTYHGIDQGNIGKINGAKFSVTLNAELAGEKHYQQVNQPQQVNNHDLVDTGQGEGVYVEPPNN